MATKEECDRYANELAKRFEELTGWAIANWPDKQQPLMPSDFTESRKEISRIIGPRLGDGAKDPPPSKDAPFIPVSPMPWP